MEIAEKDQQWYGKMKQDVWTEMCNTFDEAKLKSWKRRFKKELWQAVAVCGPNARRTIRIAEQLKAIDAQLLHLKLANQ